MNKFIKTCIALFIAMNLCGIGVAIFVQANLGSDTITVIEEGISKTFLISLGNASRLFNIFFLIIALFIAREYIGWCTIAYGLLVGSFIDFYDQLLLSYHIAEMNVFIRILLIIIGQLFIVLTFAILIKYRNGMNQIDAVSYGLEKYTSISYKTIRTGFDVLFIVAGWLLGGVVGIGSIFTMLTTGIGIDMCLKILGGNNCE